MRKALFDLRQSPWFCPLIFFPKGAHMMGHSFGPINGLLALPLYPFMGDIAAHNALIAFHFVAAACAAFALAYDMTRHWPAALAAGFLFGFSPYHIAHAHGHMNLVSMAGLPLFLLAWRSLLRGGSVPSGLAAGCALGLCLLSDPLYFVYACMGGAILAADAIARPGEGGLRRSARSLLLLWRGWIAFALSSAALTLPILVPFYWANREDVFLGGHPPELYSADFLAPWIPGGVWRWGALTRGFWGGLPGGPYEGAVGVGFGAAGLAAAGWRARRAEGERLAPWLAMAAIFWALALGPSLQSWGQSLGFDWMPYRAFVALAPPLRLSGVPGRMMAMAGLALAALAAFGIKALWGGGRRGRMGAAALMSLALVEHWPAPLPVTPCPIPPYAKFLRDWPEPGAVFDAHAYIQLSMVLQTVHGRPISFGFTAKAQRSRAIFEHFLRETAKRALEEGDLAPLRDYYNFRLLVVGAGEPHPASAKWPKPIYEDAEVKIYDLAEFGQGAP